MRRATVWTYLCGVSNLTVSLHSPPRLLGLSPEIMDVKMLGDDQKLNYHYHVSRMG